MDRAKQWLPTIAIFCGCAAAAAAIWAPIAIQRAVEGVRFSDRLGTFPVQVSLCHNGRSTLDTGVFGKVFWAQTGAFGFGAYARASGPPEAGGTLASYVDPAFIETNVVLINDPVAVVEAYSERFADGLRDQLLVEELVAALVGGAFLFAILPRRRLREAPAAREVAVALLLVIGGVGVSAGVAVVMFNNWTCSEPVAREYAMPGVSGLSFESPQTREVAEQVRPAIERNNLRTEQGARHYLAQARVSFERQLSLRATALEPREGETIVLAEGDPQGSFAGVRVRRQLYADLVEALGAEAISLRTISGDVSSNGTVAESAYIAEEATVSGEIPTVAVGGDHDSEATWKQMTDEGLLVADLETIEVAGLRVSGANDREHKTLFGGIITNESGISEQELGAQLRQEVDDQARIVLLHQPDAAAGYLGLDSLTLIREIDGSPTVPHEDGFPDQPPGVVSIGHLHEVDGPWVLWNTDGDQITWTVVDQLGTAGGVENQPTFNQFSTPASAPLKPLTVRLQYVNVESGLQTGYATITCRLDGTCSISDRVDVGLPGGQALAVN